MNKFSIFFALILLGIVAIVTQVVFIRELIVVFSGNELSIGIILSNWLLLEAVGSYLAGRWAVKIRSGIFPYTILQWLLAIILPISIYLTRLVPSSLNLVTGEAIDILTILYTSFLLLIPICLINGAQFSIGCLLLSKLEKKGASLVGRVFALEAIGSVLGGAIVTYICLRYLNSIQTIFILSSLNIFSALLLLQFISHKTKDVSQRNLFILKTAHIGLLLALLIITFTGKINLIQQTSIQKQWPDYKIVSNDNSIYGNVTLIERAGQWHLLSNGVSIATLPTPDIAEIEDIAHFPLLFHPDPKTVFLLGGGIGGVIKELLKYQLKSIDYTELDPLLINTTLSYAPDSMVKILQSSRLHTHNFDGRYFLRMTNNKYDVIILNLPDPSTLVLNRFFTTEFFKLCQSHLNEDGILFFQISGSSSYMNDALIKLTNSLLNSASISFSHIRIIPFETTLFIASNKILTQTDELKTLTNRLKLRRIETKLFSDLYLKYKLDSTRVIWFENERNKFNDILINRDLSPAALFYNLLYINSSLSPLVASVYSWFENVSTAEWSVLIFLVFLALYFLKFKSKVHSRSALIIAIFSTGLVGMSITIIFILTFQSYYGYIYFWIGLIISAFMVGISTGGFWGSKYVTRKDITTYIFYKLEGYICLYLLLTMLTIYFLQDFLLTDTLYMSLPYIMLFLTFICGILVGTQFPIANFLYLKNQTQFTRTAGIFYASDLLGAWAGGLLITLIYIPILGIIKTLLLLVIIKLGTMILCRLSG